jgi:short-subunit dehydrogenase
MHEVVNNSPNWLWMDSRTVAQQGFDAVMKGKTLIINGTLNKAFVILAKFIPDKVTRSVAKYLSKRSY